MPIAPEDQARIEEIAAGFKHILDQQFAMHLRVARRTTSVVRFGMISLAVVGVSMFLLLLTLAYQIQPMIGAVASASTPPVWRIWPIRRPREPAIGTDSTENRRQRYCARHPAR